MGLTRLLSILTRTLLAASTLALVAGIVALVLLLESGVMTARILRIANHFLGPAAGLRVGAEAIRWRPWSGLALAGADVLDRESGVPLFAVESLEVGYDFLGIASRTPHIEHVKLVRPSIDLGAILAWNERRPGHDAPPDSVRGRRIAGGLRIDSFEIDEGVLFGEGGLRLSGIRLVGSLDGSGRTWRLGLDEIATRIRRGPIDERVDGQGQISLVEDALSVDRIVLATQSARLSINGRLVAPRSGEFMLHAVADSIALERVGAWIGSPHPLLRGTAGFDLIAQGTTERQRIDGSLHLVRPGRAPDSLSIRGWRAGSLLLLESLELANAASRVEVAGQLELGEATKYSATVAVEGVDPFDYFASTPPVRATSLTGNIRFDGSGFTRASFDGEARARLGPSSIRGVPFDSADLVAAGKDGAFRLRRVRVMRGASEISGEGVLDPANQIAANLEGHVADLADLGGIVPDLPRDVLQGVATAQVTVAGPISGPRADASLLFDDASILGARAGHLEITIATDKIGKDVMANVQMRGEDVGTETWRVPESEASLVVSAGLVEISNLRATSAERGEITLAGDVEIEEEGGATARVGSLRILAPDGSTAWTNDGEITIAHKDGTTRIEGIDLRSGEGRVEGAVARGPGSRTRVSLTGDAVRLEDFTPYLRLSRPLSGIVSFESDLALEEDRLSGRLDLDLVQGMWGSVRLDSVVVRTAASSERIDVERVMVRADIADIDLAGSVRASEPGLGHMLASEETRSGLLDALSFENVRLSLRASDLDAVRRRFHWFPSPGGSGTVEATIAGTPREPDVRLQGDIQGSHLGPTSLDRFTFIANFADSLIDLDECILEAEGGHANIEAQWPLGWSIAHPKPALLHDRPLDLRVSVERFPVRVFAVIDTLFNMGSGPFWAQAGMTGTLNEPHVEGAFRVEDGKLHIPFFDRPLSNGVLNGRLHTGGIEIPTFVFDDGWSSGSDRGTARGKARIDFDRLKIVDYRVDVRTEDFRYRGYAGIDATCDGVIALTPMQWSPEKKVPRFIGNFTVEKAALDERILLPPEPKNVAPPGVMVPVETDSTLVLELEVDETKAPPLLMTMAFSGTKNLWLRTPDIEVEFAGNMTLHVTERYVGITGEVRSLRGKYSFYNTTFDIERGEIEFTDPEHIGESYVSALATTNVLDEDVEVHVSGTIAKPLIESTSSSGYSEAEIYRLLALRIKPTDPDAGPPTDQSDFSRELLASWGALVASRFGRDLSRELGIDTFDVNVGESSSQVGVGKYLGRDFFVRYRQQVASQSTQGVTEEVHETPERQLLLEYRLSRIFRLQGETGTIEGDGYLNVDLMAEWGY